MPSHPFNGRVAAVTRREYWQRVTNTWFLVATFLVPVGLIAILLLPTLLIQQEAESGPLRVAVLAPTGAPGNARTSISELAEYLVHSDTLARPSLPRDKPVSPLPSTGTVELSFVPSSIPAPPSTSIPTLLDSLRTSGVDAYLIPPDNARGGGTAQVYAVRSIGLAEQTAIQRSVRKAAISYLLTEENLSPEVTDRVLRASELGLSVSQVSAGGTRSQEVVRAVSLGAGVLLYMLLLVYGQMIVRSVMEEKNSDIAEILLSSVRPWELMSGKIIGVAAVGLTQTFVWGLLAAGVVLYALSSPATSGLIAEFELGALNVPYLRLALSFFGYFLLGYFLYASIFAATGAMVGSESETQQVTLPVMLLIVAAFVFLIPVIEAPQATWARVVSQVPLFSPILMLARVTAGTATGVEIVLSVVLLVTTIAFTMWLSGRIYRVGILMSGKRPTLPEVVRWIRYG